MRLATAAADQPQLTTRRNAVCRDASVCPPKTDALGALVQPTGCSSASLVPTTEELSAGKDISCTCGGDAATEQLCQARGRASGSASRLERLAWS